MNCRRYILLCALCSAFCILLQAQPRLQTPEIYIGVHGGVSASTIWFNPAVDYMTPITQACVLGGNGGLVFRYAKHKCCAIQIEINYQHRGWREHIGANDASTYITNVYLPNPNKISTAAITSTTPVPTLTYTRELHYIELPLLMNINFGNERWRGFFNLGPQIGYCIKDNRGEGEKINPTKYHYETPIDHPFDWGLAGGLGFYYRSRNAGLYQLEARFNYSFGGIYGTQLVDHFSMASPMDLSVNLAWMWEFKGRK